MPAADAEMDTRLRADMLDVPKDKVPPATTVFDFSFAEKALAELKAEGWKPKP